MFAHPFVLVRGYLVKYTRTALHLGYVGETLEGLRVPSQTQGQGGEQLGTEATSDHPLLLASCQVICLLTTHLFFSFFTSEK